MSDTPRTDAKQERFNVSHSFWAGFAMSAPFHFAKQLERELAAMTAQRDALLGALDRIAYCDQDCSDRGAVFFMRGIAECAIDAAKGPTPEDSSAVGGTK